MGFLGNALHNNKIQEAVHSQVLGQFVFVLVAFLALVWSFLADDFSRLCCRAFEYNFALAIQS